MNYLSKINNSHETEELEMILSTVECDCNCSVILKLVYEEIRSLRKLSFDVLNTVPSQQKEYTEYNCMENKMETCNNLKDKDAMKSENMRTDGNVIHEENPQNTVLLEKTLAGQATILEVIHNIRDNQSYLEAKYHQNQEEIQSRIESVDLKVTQLKEEQSNKLSELLSDQKLMTKTCEEKQKLIETSLNNLRTGMESLKGNVNKALEGQSDKFLELLSDQKFTTKSYDENKELIQASLKKVTTRMDSMDLNLAKLRGEQSNKLSEILSDQKLIMTTYDEKQELIKASLKNLKIDIESMNLNVIKEHERQSDKFLESLTDQQKVTRETFENKQDVLQTSLKNLTARMESINLKSTELSKRIETPPWKLKANQLMENNTIGIINIPDWMDSDHIALIDAIRKSYPDKFFLLFPNLLNFDDSKDVKDILGKNCLLGVLYPYIQNSSHIIIYLTLLVVCRNKILEIVKDHIPKL